MEREQYSDLASRKSRWRVEQREREQELWMNRYDALLDNGWPETIDRGPTLPEQRHVPIWY